MTATMRMEVEGISSAIIKLIDESDSQCTNDTKGQCRKEEFTVNRVGNPRPDNECQEVNKDDNNRRYDEIAQFQP